VGGCSRHVGRTVIAVLAAAALLAAAPVASADRAIALRYSVNQPGDVAIAANTLLTCPDSAPSCPAGQAGTATGAALGNNGYVMRYVDEDGDPTTFDSSSAQLILPARATVTFAGLYYGARFATGTGGAPASDTSAAGRATVRLKVPGASGYTTLGPADTVLDDAANARYQGFIDVTSSVRAAGSGTYWVANVQSATGMDRYAGWTLVVVYLDLTAPTRNLTVFDGLVQVASNTAASIPVSGFRTPATGPVRTRLGFLAYDAERSTTGKTASLDGAPLADPANAANNFFHSAISVDGIPFTAKTPNYDNQLGYDAKLVRADGILPNGATSASVLTSAKSDSYLAGMVAFATELFAPRVQETKTVQDLTHPGGPVAPGDRLRYTVGLANNGEDGAVGVRAHDDIPAATTYVAGSLAVLTGANAGAKTDARDADQAEFGAGRVVLRLGSGADGSAGGSLAPGESASFRFEVTVDAVIDATTITNRAQADYFAQTLGTPISAETSPTATVVSAPDLTLTKAHAPPFLDGTPTTFTLTATNRGSLATTGPVSVTDTFAGPPAGFAAVAVVSAPGWACTVLGQTLGCTRSDALPAGRSYPAITVRADVVAPAAPQLANTAHVAGGADTNPSNDFATDIGPATSRADLAVTKVADRSTVAAGGRIHFEVVVRNDGPSPAVGVALGDPLPAGVYAEVSVTPDRGTCTAAARCTLGTLAAGEAVRIAIDATVVADAGAQTNTATVTSASVDPVAANNTAQAGFDVAVTADVAVEKAGTPARPGAGEPFTYTLTARDLGPDTATTVVVTDPLPSDFVRGAVDAPGFACSAPTSGSVLRCTRPSLAAATGPVTITVTGTIAAGSAGRVIHNAARITADQRDPDPSDDTAAVSALAGPAADIEVLAFGPADPVLPGATATVTLTAADHGPDDASDVVLELSIPAGFDPVGVPAPCAPAGDARHLTCALGALAAGASRSLDLVLLASASALGPTANVAAAIGASQADPVGENNRSSAPIEVAPQPPGAPPPAPPDAQPGPAPTAALRTPAPKTCTSSRRFTIHLREHRGRQLRSATITVAGERIAARRRPDGRLIATIDLRHVPKGTYRVAIDGRLRDGRRVIWTRTYETCAGKRPPSNRLDEARSL
jgi:uncharacterized repeat protein (TIGR01451 family)